MCRWILNNSPWLYSCSHTGRRVEQDAPPLDPACFTWNWIAFCYSADGHRWLWLVENAHMAGLPYAPHQTTLDADRYKNEAREQLFVLPMTGWRNVNCKLNSLLSSKQTAGIECSHVLPAKLKLPLPKSYLICSLILTTSKSWII